MKVGILTHFHKSTNYGGVLQAYALCRILNNGEHSAYQILYLHKLSKITPERLTPINIYKKIVLRLKRKISYKKDSLIKKKMESLFCDFRDAVPHTLREYTKENISDTVNEFDAFIVGSDQVWNPNWYDSTYMLDFVGNHRLKMSYAASIGVDCLNENQKEIYKAKLTDFDCISVREIVAAEIISQIIDNPINVSVDPTLLLSANEWDDIASAKKIKEKYIFLYLLGDDMSSRKLAEKFARAKGLKIVMIPDLLGRYRSNDRKICADKVTDVTPNDFISLIKYAEYIITDSFHACVFSVLYKKQFYAFDRIGIQEMGSRIENLTRLFECPDHFCSSKKERSIENLLSLEDIDYSKDHTIFEAEKERSMNYLETYLFGKG